MATITEDPSSAAPDFSLYDLEFRSTVDDAWYSVRAVLEGETLVVKFWGFDDKSDEKFGADEFQTVSAVDEFCRRFRPYSEQMQDDECRSLEEGLVICAALTAGDGSVRFYDARLDSVNHIKHQRTRDGEECMCTFVVWWVHGPNEGQQTFTSIANICRVKSFKNIDTRVASFSKMAKEKIENVSLALYDSRSHDSASFHTDGMAEKEQNGKSVDYKSSKSQKLLQVKEEVRDFNSLALINPGNTSNVHERNLEDADLGGESLMELTGGHYFIVIDNMEKNLPPTSVTEFLHKQTAISPQAYVFPSLTSDSYTRGAVVLDSKEKFRVIYDFLNNPGHMIVSSNGRPWVIIGTPSRCGHLRETIGSLVPISQKRSIDDELRVVRQGSKEFETAKSLKKLFMAFLQHLQILHERLAAEEKKILQL